MRYVEISNGRRIYVRADDERGRELIKAGGNLNPGSLELWTTALKLHDWLAVVDVGSNYGEMLVWPNLPLGAQVIAFEPNRELHQCFSRTAREAGLDVELRSEAVSSIEGNSVLRVDSSWSGKSSLVGSDVQEGGGNKEGTEVSTTTIDRLLSETLAPACIKVDVEGHEAGVLAGAGRYLANSKHWVVQIEILHMSSVGIAQIAGRHNLFMFDRRSSNLIRVPGRNSLLVDTMRSWSWLYPQDCLIVSDAVREVIERNRRL